MIALITTFSEYSFYFYDNAVNIYFKQIDLKLDFGPENIVLHKKGCLLHLNSN